MLFAFFFFFFLPLSSSSWDNVGYDGLPNLLKSTFQNINSWKEEKKILIEFLFLGFLECCWLKEEWERSIFGVEGNGIKVKRRKMIERVKEQNVMVLVADNMSRFVFVWRNGHCISLFICMLMFPVSFAFQCPDFHGPTPYPLLYSQNIIKYIKLLSIILSDFSLLYF